MKAYGHKRKDKLECDWGCCCLKGNPNANGRPKIDRAARKRARRIDKDLSSVG